MEGAAPKKDHRTRGCGTSGSASLLWGLSSVNGGCSVYFIGLCDEVATFSGLNFLLTVGPPGEWGNAEMLLKYTPPSKGKLGGKVEALSLLPVFWIVSFS